MGHAHTPPTSNTAHYLLSMRNFFIDGLIVAAFFGALVFQAYYWNSRGYHEGMQDGTNQATEVALKQFQTECNESFDQLQTYGILVDRSNTRTNWDYIQVLLCDGKHAGETPDHSIP